MARLSGDMLRGHLDAMVLASLERGEAHGFEIMARLNREGRDAFEMKEGTVYPVLYRLERAGYLKARLETDSDTPRKGPQRRFYRLTAKGARELQRRRDEWALLVRAVGNIVEAH